MTEYYAVIQDTRHPENKRLEKLQCGTIKEAIEYFYNQCFCFEEIIEVGRR